MKFTCNDMPMTAIFRDNQISLLPNPYKTHCVNYPESRAACVDACIHHVMFASEGATTWQIVSRYVQFMYLILSYSSLDSIWK